MTPTQTLWKHLLNLTQGAQRCQWNYSRLSSAFGMGLLVNELRRIEGGISGAYALLEQIPDSGIGTPKAILEMVLVYLQNALIMDFQDARRERDINEAVRSLAVVAPDVWKEPEPAQEEIAYPLLQVELLVGHGSPLAFQVRVTAGTPQIARHLEEVDARGIVPALSDALALVRELRPNDLMLQYDFENLAAQLARQQEPATPAD